MVEGSAEPLCFNRVVREEHQDKIPVPKIQEPEYKGAWWGALWAMHRWHPVGSFHNEVREELRSGEKGAEEMFPEDSGVLSLCSLWQASHPQVVPSAPILTIFSAELQGYHLNLESVD